MIHTNVGRTLSASAAALLLTACEGVFSGVYDKVPAEDTVIPAEGQIRVDASDWTRWHYLDIPALAEGADPADATVSMDIPLEKSGDSSGPEGIYTYWYDVFGQGISRREFREFMPTTRQPEPDTWTIAVHRNNLRTNGGAIARTSCATIDGLPLTEDYLSTLRFVTDEWNETDVWVVRERMLAGLIGNQGISVNSAGSAWLHIDIPPMPPAFSIDSGVLVLRLADGTYAALQLADYQNAAGVKCCLTINYRYPVVFS